MEDRRNFTQLTSCESIVKLWSGAKEKCLSYRWEVMSSNPDNATAICGQESNRARRV